MTQNQNEKMRDFIASLENNQFSKDQEAMLLVGNAENLQAGENKICENRASSCDASLNEKRCTNISEKGCAGSSNTRHCSLVEDKEDDMDEEAGLNPGLE